MYNSLAMRDLIGLETVDLSTFGTVFTSETVDIMTTKQNGGQKMSLRDHLGL